MVSKKFFVSLFVLVSLALPSFAYEKMNWKSRAMTAGKASLTSDSYQVVRNLGTPNFSPEFRMPLQLVYDSSKNKNGIAGSVWQIPQLESRAFPRGNSVEWITPWGEKIRFFHKDPKNKDILDIFKQEMKGRGCFAPFQNWDAKGKKGNWTISGKKDNKGWSFTYRDSRLKRISSPAGRSISFAYQGGKLRKVMQNGTLFVALSYDRGGKATEIVVNGVKHSLSYTKLPYVTLPTNIANKAKNFDRFVLTSVKRGTLNPVKYSYDSYGYLNKIEQGEFKDELKIARETPAECLKYLNKIADLRKRKKSTRRLTENRNNITGRIISDSFFKYSYRKKIVSIRNKNGKKATYDYNIKRGILTISNFAGLTTKTYFFRRYDVAYNGKIRQVRDAQDRVVINYRYDKKLGKPIRIRDMADNETYYQYDRRGNMIKVSRSPGFDGENRQPLMKIGYNGSGDAVKFSRLDANGRPVLTTRISYNGKHEITSISNGQTNTSISYNNFGLPTQVTDTFLNSSAYRYDKFNRLQSLTVVNGVKTHYQYTAEGLISRISRTCPLDDVKDMIKVGKQPPKGSLGGEYLLSSVKVDYNADGLAMSISDNQGRVKTYDRDKMGRIIKELFPNKTSNAYKFTVTGQVSKVLDRRHNPIAFKWNKFGKIEQKKTAAGQFTDYVYDQYGLLQSIVSRFKKKDAVDRKIQYTYNDLDRLTAVDYGNGQKKILKYDSWGKLVKAVSTDGDTRRVVFNKYDEFDRVVRNTETVFNKGKAQSAIERTYAYSPYGKRTRLTVTTYGLMGGKMVKQDVLKTTWKFNKFGQLVKIEKGSDVVEYLYNAQGRVLKRTSNGMKQYYTYTPLEQLETKSLGAPYDSEKNTAIATLKYIYATDGSIHSREVNGAKQSYKYDQIGQLTAVLNAAGEKVEKYVYDEAGNILKKDIAGEITTYTYDKSNQLVSSTTNSKTTNYQYDAAGRLIKEGGKSYAYGWLDKVMSITQNAKVSNSYSYSMDGQIASAETSGEKESFLWDGMALIKRGTTEYIYEPAVTGGNPILANGNALFNDMLGTTLGKYDGKKFIDNQSTGFGSGAKSGFFTGKPHVQGLGYAFLFRNYRSSLGKWQTQDPLGYPDGWNNLAYCNNRVTDCIDWLGGEIISDGFVYYNPATGNFEQKFGSITYTQRIVFELVFMSSNYGSTGPGQNLTITASSNLSYSTAQSDTVSIGYSGGGFSATGSITSTASTTVTNGATSSTTIGENSSATISLYQKKKKFYYDYTYIAPTFAGDPSATPVTGTYYGGSYMTAMYVTIITE